MGVYDLMKVAFGEDRFSDDGGERLEVVRKEGTRKGMEPWSGTDDISGTGCGGTLPNSCVAALQRFPASPPGRV